MNAWRKALEAWCILRAERMFHEERRGDSAVGWVCAAIGAVAIVELIARGLA